MITPPEPSVVELLAAVIVAFGPKVTVSTELAATAATPRSRSDRRQWYPPYARDDRQSVVDRSAIERPSPCLRQS